MREKTERLEAESLGYRRTADEAETSAEQIKSERRGMQREVFLSRTQNESVLQHLINSMTLFCPKGPFTNDVSREGEGRGCPNSDVVREVA